METHNDGLEDSTLQGHQALPTVVAVDDDEDSLVLLSYVIEDFPCHFLSETDGKAALKKIASVKPNLILLDIRLPGFSGFDIIRRLKSSLDTASIPVVAVTALAGQRYQKELLAAGFDRYICKPYGLSDIQTVIQQYL